MQKIISAVLASGVFLSGALASRGFRDPRVLISDTLVNEQAAPQQVAGQLTPATTATVYDGPQGKELARLSTGSALTVLARERGWVRVRVEGWVNESELVPLDSNLRASPSAADIRADPEGMKGRLVRWDMEFISWQQADPLRKDMKTDEWYILARGPGSENAISYLVVPANLRSIASNLSPLSRIVVTARVRVGRSAPVGVPVLDVESLNRR